MTNRSTPDVVAPPAAAASSPVVQPPSEPVAAENPAQLDPAAASSYLASITDNYGQYRAVAQIPWGNVIAFNAGDPVNADHPALEQFVSDGLVEKVAKSGRGK